MFRSKKIILVFLFALLVLPGLGTRPLWQDEAETALVARQMINSGVYLPYAYDDEGPISQDWNYQFKVSSLWRWHPWLQFYVAAASFKLLGISAFSARLPFALIGIASYWYFLNFLARHSVNPSLRGRAIAAALMLFSVPLLLHLRQARYYSLSLLFTLLTIDGYLGMKRSLLAVRQGDSLKYIFGSIFLFHSFLPGALALQISFWFHQLINYINARRSSTGYIVNRRLKTFSILFSINLLFTLPWAIWLKIGGQNLNFSPELIKQHLIQHYLYIHKFIFPAFVLIPLIPTVLKLFQNSINKSRMARAGDPRRAPAAVNVWRGRRTGVKPATGPDPLLLSFETILFFSIFISISLLLYTFNHPYFFRYLIPLIPLFIYIAAWIIANSRPIWSIIPLISLILMTAVIFPKYLYEIANPPQTANAEIIQFLASLPEAKYKTLAVNYDDFTFRFHTNYRVFGAQQLNSVPCPDVVIIFPDWGNDTLLREISQNCQLEPYPLSLHYAKLADDPDPTNHRFTPPPLRTLEAFLAPLAPS